MANVVNRHRTVQRLTSIRRFVEARKNLTERHLEILLHKLLAHEMKYSDIAIKLNVRFLRIAPRAHNGYINLFSQKGIV